jgi:DNA-directed RNA polymerase specialized sigma24 family protein
MRGAAAAVESALQEFTGRMTLGPRASVAGDLTEQFIRRLCVLCEASLMPTDQRTALTLRYMIGLTDYEAARTMGMDVMRYRDLLSVALTRIEGALDPTELQVLMATVEAERMPPKTTDWIEETRQLLSIGLVNNTEVMRALSDRDRECVNMVMRALGDLEPRQQRYLRLSIAEQMAQVDIGAVVGKSRFDISREINEALRTISACVFG